MRAPLALVLLLARAPVRTARPIADSTLGLSEVAWAPSFTHRSEGPLAGCSATGPVAGSQCLGPSFYLGTPSVVRSPSTGNLLVAADLFDHGPSAECWPNFFVAHRVPGWEWERNATLFQSRDNGTSWEFRAWVPKHYWSSLFSHEGAVYYMGVSDDKAGGVKLSRSTVRLNFPTPTRLPCRLTAAPAGRRPELVRHDHPRRHALHHGRHGRALRAGPRLARAGGRPRPRVHDVQRTRRADARRQSLAPNHPATL